MLYDFRQSLLFTGIEGAEEFAEIPESYCGARDMPWEEDVVGQALVKTFGPMSLLEVGTVMGLSDERVRQIEEEAMEKCRAELDPEKGDIIAQLRELLSMRSEPVYPEETHTQMSPKTVAKRVESWKRKRAERGRTGSSNG